MQVQDRRGVAVLAVLLVAVAGCSRLGGTRPMSESSAQAAPAVVADATAQPTTGPTTHPTEAVTSSATPEAAASAPPEASPSPKPEPSPTPVSLAPPDLGDIEDLLEDLDAALGADATADADEGTP
jgi:hypothetical protein